MDSLLSSWYPRYPKRLWSKGILRPCPDPAFDFQWQVSSMRWPWKGFGHVVPIIHINKPASIKVYWVYRTPLGCCKTEKTMRKQADNQQESPTKFAITKEELVLSKKVWMIIDASKHSRFLLVKLHLPIQNVNAGEISISFLVNSQPWLYFH